MERKIGDGKGGKKRMRGCERGEEVVRGEQVEFALLEGSVHLTS